MDDHPLVAIIVPVHNEKKHTEEFLESFKSVTYPNFKIIVIDDGSTDGTEDMIRNKYPYVCLLKGDGNLFWSRAFNLGAHKARKLKAEYILQIDNDTRVDPDFLSVLVDTARKYPDSIITSKVLYFYDPKRLIDAGGGIDWLRGGLFLRGYDEIDGEKYDEVYEVKYGVMGFLVKTAYFFDIGMIDSRCFPHWRGEVDFMLRARKKGYRIIYQPKSRIWHKVSSTAKKKIYTNRRFLNLPLSTLFFAFSKRSQGGPLSLYELIRFYARHFPFFYVPYALFWDIIGRIQNEKKERLYIFQNKNFYLFGQRGRG